MLEAGAFSEERLTVGGAVRLLAAAFGKAGVATPALDARMLAAHACGLSQEDIVAKRDAVLTAAMAESIRHAAARRLMGEPVSRIVGSREFWGLSFSLSPHTLDPRPETEHLVEAVLDHVQRYRLASQPLRVLDLGTGSGCLLAAILSELPLSSGVAIDLNCDAALAARENLRRLGLLPRAAFLCGNWAEAIKGASFDIIVSNPPYIASSAIGDLAGEVKDHDPLLALDGGADGLDAYRAIFAHAFGALRAFGFIAVETGAAQASAVCAIMDANTPPDSDIETKIFTDLNEIERAVAGVRQLRISRSGSKKKVGNPPLSG